MPTRSLKYPDELLLPLLDAGIATGIGARGTGAGAAGAGAGGFVGICTETGDASIDESGTTDTGAVVTSELGCACISGSALAVGFDITGEGCGVIG